MPKYKVEVIETIIGFMEVEAESRYDAEERAKEEYARNVWKMTQDVERHSVTAECKEKVE